MKRYYFSPIIGTGNETDPFRAAIADLAPDASVAVIPSDPTNGHPLFPFALCLVSDKDHQRFLSDPRIDALPDAPLDLKIAAMPQAVQQGLSTAIAKRGLPATIISQADRFRHVVRGIGQHLEAAFDEHAFDAS